MSERDVQHEVLTALGELKAEQASVTTEVRNIVSRHDKLNGTVGRHEQRMNGMQIEVAERRNNCPLVEHAQAALANHIADCPIRE